MIADIDWLLNQGAGMAQEEQWSSTNLGIKVLIPGFSCHIKCTEPQVAPGASG